MEPETLPPPDPAPEAMPSLADRLGAAARAAPGGRATGIMLAILLPAASVALTFPIERAIRRDMADSEPGSERSDPVRAERRTLAALGPGSFAADVERVARLMPADARLASLEIDRQEDRPRLYAEIATADPDALRAALSRGGGGRPLRIVNERRGDGVMIVAVEGAP